MPPQPDLLIVAGPTCSGKSALALVVAERIGGSIVNADAMQCHAALRIVTARPDAAAEAMVPHFLYGVLPPDQAGGAAWWRAEAWAAIARVRQAGRVPILCGGSGLYLKVLLEGLADIPAPGEAARAEARDLLTSMGAAALHARLGTVDPRTAAQLRPNDRQRVARAWEVWRGTGTGLAEWQARQNIEPVPPTRAILLLPPREALREAIRQRWAAMMAAGALEEVRALLRLDLDPGLPVMRAHGVPELAAALRGETTLAAAGETACVATLRYVKRQVTWFRHHVLAPAEATVSLDARFTDVQQLKVMNPLSHATLCHNNG